MGKRGWKFKCLDCNREFSEYFEWVTASNIDNKTDKILCHHCDSNNWKITDKTSFSGGKEMKVKEIVINCKNCYSDWYVQFGGLTKQELVKLVKNQRCVDCDNGEPQITDGIKT